MTRLSLSELLIPHSHIKCLLLPDAGPDAGDTDEYNCVSGFKSTEYGREEGMGHFREHPASARSSGSKPYAACLRGGRKRVAGDEGAEMLRGRRSGRARRASLR